MIQGNLDGKKKDAHWGDKSSAANGRLCPNPESARASKLLLFTSAGLIQLCTKLAAQSNHKRRRVKIIYFMTYINESYPLESAPEIDWTAVSGLSEEPEAAERETKQLGCLSATRRPSSRIQEVHHNHPFYRC